MAAAAEETWRATLIEVRRQALRGGTDGAGAADASTSGRSASGGSTSGRSAGAGSEADWVRVEAPEPAPHDGEPCARWPQAQWQVAFELLLCQMPSAAKSLQPHQDDLLFFVRSQAAGQGAAAPAGSPGAVGAGGPLFVRRRGPALPPELAVGGARSAEVDWHASVLLNIALQTGYRLAVATCRWAGGRAGWLLGAARCWRSCCLVLLLGAGSPSWAPIFQLHAVPSLSIYRDYRAPSLHRHEDLASLVSRDGPGPLTPPAAGAGGPSSSGGGGSSVREVCKVVHASPSRVHISLDSSRGRCAC